jgi:hypothetical protein
MHTTSDGGLTRGVFQRITLQLEHRAQQENAKLWLLREIIIPVIASTVRHFDFQMNDERGEPQFKVELGYWGK